MSLRAQDIRVKATCLACGELYVSMPAPPGHEDHDHIRCNTCIAIRLQPPWQCFCVRHEVTVDGKTGGDA